MRIRNISKNNISKTILFLGVLNVLLLFLVTFQKIFIEGGSDLRNRIVGARVYLAGKDPYFFHWEKGMPETWIDTHSNPMSLVTRLTVPPTILILHLPFALLSFMELIVYWFGIQWLLLLVTILVWLRVATKIEVKKKVLLASCMFASSFFWVTHVMVGQIYVLYIFLVSVGFLLISSKGRLRLFGYFLLGIVAAMRPPYILFLVTIFIFQHKRFFLTCLAGLILMMFLSFIATGPSLWKSYADAMKVYATMPVHSEAILDSVTAKKIYPATIENITFLDDFGGYITYDSSIKSLAQKYFQILISPVVLYFGAAIFAIWFLRRIYPYKTLVRQRPVYFFLFTMLLIIGLEFFLPTPRYSYYDVQLILPCILLILIDRKVKIRDILLLAAPAYISYLLASVMSFSTYIIYAVLLRRSLKVIEFTRE